MRTTAKEKAEGIKRFAQFAGFIAARQTGAPEHASRLVDIGPGRGWVTMYDSLEQGIDPADGGKYLLICEAHASTVNVNSKRAGMATLAIGSTEFCDCCREQCTGCYDKCTSCGKGGDDK